jgi:hypothetical protein
MMKIARVVALAAAVLVGRSATAQEFADLNKPITLDLGLLPFVKSLEPIGGWPLTIRMLANKPIGLGTQPQSFALPPYGSALPDKAWIVWSNPDGKFSFGCDSTNLPSGFNCPPIDETYLEFTLGLPVQGGTLPRPPPVSSYNGVNGVNNGTRAVGPAAGYGASPAVPGLVILSDTGVGREFISDPVTGITQKPTAINLAGFVNSVAWTANDRMPLLPRTVVTAQMNVPYALFMPIVLADRGRVPFAPITWQIDGKTGTGPDTDLVAALNARVTTVRIFVLDGPAPDKIPDLKGDGTIDSRDALLMTNPVTGKPYKLLSGERVIKFQTLVEEFWPIDFDFDGNGMFPPVAPPGGGTIKTPPR